ncbi:MAG: DUF1294 domain-containing protein [Bacteroidetes bacterium]|nr:DUF1294 domain-containing protein [Bacteroidota bacterium]
MLIVYYFLIINLLSAIVFYTDKRKAIKNRRRIPEATLHLLEFFGGVFSNLLLMYLIHHKNRKASYFLITYFIAIAWIVFLYKIDFPKLFTL